MTAVVDRIAAWQRTTEIRRRRPRVQAPRYRRMVAVLVGGWGLLCAAQLALSYRDAAQGMREATSVRRDLAAEGLAGGQAEVRLDQARRSFQDAHRRSASAVLAPVRALPVLG
ncbi:MAG: hypothetical protein M3326_12800, partial [Actinomycetota bacterium]|nr:hypothetical protein [Actinomycetota bacterium]